MTRLQNQMTTVAAAFWLLPALASAGQVDPPAVEWETTYSERLFGLHDTCMKLGDFQEAMDGGYIIVGRNGVYLVKVGPRGMNDWARTYDLSSAYGGSAVHEKSDGSYIVSYNRLDATNGTMPPGLMQTDQRGNLVWSTVLGSERGPANSMDVTRDGGYVVAGGRINNDSRGSTDVMLIKANSAGEVLWSRTYGGTGEDEDEVSFSVQETSDGGFILGARTTGYGAMEDGFHDFLLVKTDEDGREQWFKTYARPEHVGFCKARQTADGGYILGGWGSPDSWLLKTDASGNEQWSKGFSRAENAWSLSDVRQTCDGGYILALNGSQLLKTDSEGNEVWSWDCAAAIRVVWQTSEGGYVAGGANMLSEPQCLNAEDSLYLVKLAPDGACKPDRRLFRRGDSDADGALQLTDAVFTLNHLFRAGPGPTCADAADADDNGRVQITDAILTLNHLFLGGQGLPGPFGSCGADSTADDLDCAAFPACQ
jgi:hypothetical protein